MICQACQHDNIAGTLFCERCGSDLENAVSADTDAVVGSAPPLLSCSRCSHANDAQYVVCERCGAPLDVPVARNNRVVDAPQRTIEAAVEPGRNQPPSSAVAAQGQAWPQRGHTKLVVEQGLVLGKQYLLTDETMVVGREDPDAQFVPQIDLGGLDEGYVHRRHAVLTFEGTFLFVTHLGGHNRTYVNNRPIGDHLPHPLNLGDTLRVGKVLLRVTPA